MAISRTWSLVLLLLGPQDDPTAELLARALEADRPAALRRVEEAREALALEDREEAERDGRIESALKELSAKSPFKLTLPGGVTLDGVQVGAYREGRFTFVWPQGRVEASLDQLPEESRAALLGAYFPKATPRDLLEIGRRLLRSRDFDRAARWVEAAARKDPSLAPFCPDVERLRKASKLFEGGFGVVGSTLSLRWTFATADQAKDLAVLKGTTLTVKPGTGLELEGEVRALAGVREIPFRNRVKASALGQETDGVAHVLGLRFLKPGGGEVIIFGAMITALKAFLVQRIEDEEVRELLPPTAGAAGNRLSLEFNDGRFVYKVGEKTVWSGKEGGFTEVEVIFGALPLSKPGAKPGRARAVFRELTVLGSVDPAWLGRKLGGYREVLASELGREHAVRLKGATERSLALSTDSILPQAPEAVRAAWPDLVAAVRTVLKTRAVADLAEARRRLDPLGSTPAVLYLQGILDEAAGDRRSAGARYDAALALLPGFPEALGARARLRVLEGAWLPALELAQRAAQLKPDLPDVHLVEARLKLEEGDTAGALAAARLARRLAPLDPDLQSLAQALANVARGPGWAKSAAVETAHYVVRTELPEAKAKAYAEHLEAVRGAYEEVLGRPAGDNGKARVLVFGSEAAYHGYLEFALGDRQEHTLGVFSPWHGQMMLYETADAEETLRVLAHEGFHQYLHRVAPEVPTWLNEGLAEYVGAAKVQSGKVVERGGIQEGRLADLKQGIRFGWKPVPFSDLMNETQAEFYGKHAPLKYAQAWSMIHYFMADERVGRPTLRAYIDRLVAGDRAGDAFAATFARTDLGRLEEGWRKHHALPAPPAPTAGDPATRRTPGSDLLALLRARQIRTPGWTIESDVLVGRHGADSRNLLDLGFEPPPEYDLKMGVTRLLHRGSLRVGLPRNGGLVVLEIDGEAGSSVDLGQARPGDPNLRPAPPVLRPGLRTSVEIQVRMEVVRLLIDGKPYYEWRTATERVVRPRELGSGIRGLFLSVVSADFQFSQIEVSWGTPAMPAPAAPAPGEKPELSMEELKERLKSKAESARIEAAGHLGRILGKESRRLLIDLLATDTPAVRSAAAQALSKHRHPQSVEALDKAIRAAQKDPALVTEYMAALRELDMCATIQVFLRIAEVEHYRYAPQALEYVASLGCVEACGGLGDLLARAVEEGRKPVTGPNGLPNPKRDSNLAALAPFLRGILGRVAGGTPRAGEAWRDYAVREATARKLLATHGCELTGKTFDVPIGKPARCPQGEGTSLPKHDDPFLRHRTP